MSIYDNIAGKIDRDQPYKLYSVKHGNLVNQNNPLMAFKIEAVSDKNWTIKKAISNTDPFDLDVKLYIDKFSELTLYTNSALNKKLVTNPNSQEQELWRKWYGYQENGSAVYKGYYGDVVINNEPMMPCHNCSIWFPVRAIEVDHSHPLKPYENEYSSINKVWRALGLANGTPTGSKVKHLTKNNWNSLNNDVIFASKKNSPFKTSGVQRGFNTDKYEMNYKGEILYSIFRAGGYSDDDMKKYCLNSLVNLVPLCIPCNRKKSNN
jgi:hypothetical protein